MDFVRSRGVLVLLVAALASGLNGAARAQAIRLVQTPTPVPGGGTIRLVPTPTPTVPPWRQPQNQSIGVDELCAILECDHVNAPSLAGVVGDVKPGQDVALLGDGFGEQGGHVVLAGVGSNPVNLTIVSWTPGAIHATVPRVVGVNDAPAATLKVVNSWGRATNEWKTPFVALRCAYPLARNGTRILECSTSVTHWNCNGHSDGNFYNPDEKAVFPIVARHRDVVTPGDAFRDPNRTYTGTDRFSLGVVGSWPIRYQIMHVDGFDGFVDHVLNPSWGNFQIQWTMRPGQDIAYVVAVSAVMPCRSGS
jgi:hypothetical protein